MVSLALTLKVEGIRIQFVVIPSDIVSWMTHPESYSVKHPMKQNIHAVKPQLAREPSKVETFTKMD